MWVPIASDGRLPGSQCGILRARAPRMLRIDHRCQRELDDLPVAVREDLADAVATMGARSRAVDATVPSDAQHGRGRSRTASPCSRRRIRVIYAVVTKNGVVLLHAFKRHRRRRRTATSKSLGRG